MVTCNTCQVGLRTWNVVQGGSGRKVEVLLAIEQGRRRLYYLDVYIVWVDGQSIGRRGDEFFACSSYAYPAVIKGVRSEILSIGEVSVRDETVWSGLVGDTCWHFQLGL